MSFFLHPQALCESSKIGAGTRVWAFVHILPGAEIGSDCNVCDHVFIENDVVVGNRVTIKCGVQLWDGVCIEDDVFIGPNATFTNDLRPRSKQYPGSFLKTHVGAGASIGANATILPGLTIGPGAMVGAGAVVIRDVPQNAIVVGNPARIVGYVGVCRKARNVQHAPLQPGRYETAVPGVSLHRLPKIVDMRGALSVGEFEHSVPFAVQRYFLVFDVPSREVRGEHAHRQCHQFLIAVRGSLSVVVDDGHISTEVTLDDPSLGLYMPPMIWGVQYRYSEDAMLLVFASEKYDREDYIREYDEFRRLCRNEKSSDGR
jgi:acetyltransferase-like isoleucine patch superfamily enzyme/dTDP-4-dehydrorhamnose 3,5-epimerase-like enzyme